jgi:hypothetical protein
MLIPAGDCYDSLQPANVEGLTPPPAGEPNPIVMAFDDESYSSSPDPTQDFYKIWQFHVDWTTPANSTFTGPFSLSSPEFDQNLCGFSRSCIPQPSPGWPPSSRHGVDLSEQMVRGGVERESRRFVGTTVTLDIWNGCLRNPA